jgi:hypothetical protein
LRLDHLGHAAWLVEAEGLRLLFDPVLGPTHHGGVFEAWPRRSVDEGALAPDFVFVSHAHADHFDVPTLSRLLARDEDLVVVTPDPLVAWAARALGARVVREVGPGERVDLDGVALVTTPSQEPLEWGALVATREATVWNGVDASHASPAALSQILARALGAVGHTELDLALVRWQPLLELASAVAGASAFPTADYGARARPRGRDPGARPRAERARRAARAPLRGDEREGLPRHARARPRRSARGRPGGPGARARGGRALRRRRRAGVARPAPPSAARRGARGRARDRPRARLRSLRPRAPRASRLRALTIATTSWAFAEGALARGLERVAPGLDLELWALGPHGGERFTYRTGAEGVRLTRGGEASVELDQRVVIDGAMLAEVVRGERAWSEPLLAGALCVDDRAYRARPGGLSRPALPAVFAYLGLGYRESERRATEHAVARARAERRARGAT